MLDITAQHTRPTTYNMFKKINKSKKPIKKVANQDSV